MHGLRRILSGGIDLDSSLRLPPGHCLVGPYDPEECHPEEATASRIAGSGGGKLKEPDRSIPLNPGDDMSGTRDPRGLPISDDMKSAQFGDSRSDGRRNADYDNPHPAQEPNAMDVVEGRAKPVQRQLQSSRTGATAVGSAGFDVRDVHYRQW